MKVNGGGYEFIVIVATIFMFIVYFGIPCLIIGLGTLLGLWEFSWGGVLALFILEHEYFEVRGGMKIMGIEREDEEDEDGD